MVEALELSWSDVETMFGKGIDIARDILEDPALPDVVARVKTIASLPKPPAPKLSMQEQLKQQAGKVLPKAPGIGLKSLVKPLDVYIFYRRNPWIVPVGIAVVLGVPLLIGYKLGKRRCPTR